MKRLKYLVKPIILLLPFFVILLTSGCFFPNYQNQNNTDTSNTVQQEYNLDDLNNYGEWVQIENYGQAWHPYVVSNWAPFDNGHWSYVDGNWTWISYEPFGWIVYHYGYWYYDSFYGWVWIPSDNVWSPANVEWNDYGDYFSWAPLPPRGVSYGHPWETNQRRYWHVVRTEDFTKDNVGFYGIGNPTVGTNVTRDVISRAPDKQLVEKSTGKPVTIIRSQRSEVKGSKKNLERMNLPQTENKKIEQNTERVKKDVLIPRDQYQKQHNEKKQEPKKDDKKRQ